MPGKFNFLLLLLCLVMVFTTTACSEAVTQSEEDLTSTLPEPTKPVATSIPAVVTDEVDQSKDVPVSTESAVTEVVIDGDPGDWEAYETISVDQKGDHQGGGFDIAMVKTFINDRYLYLLVQTHDPPDEFTQIDLEIDTEGHQYILSFNPFNLDMGFMGEITGGEYRQIGKVVGGESAIGEVVEYKMPLAVFEQTGEIKFTVRAMDGECCDFPDWYAVDEAVNISPLYVDEKEKESEIVQVCGDESKPPVTIGEFKTAELENLEDGYTAEWFVEPSAFNMPQEVMISPEGEILILAIRSHMISKLGLDGTVELLADDAWGYMGDVDSNGDLYLYFDPAGWITRITPDGETRVLIRSSELEAVCEAGMGFGPDGNLYIAVGDSQDDCSISSFASLYRIDTSSGGIMKVAEVPGFYAFKVSPDGRFIAATFDTVYELFLDDFSSTPLFTIPGGDVTPSGLAFDDEGLLYIATGDRAVSGKLYRSDLSVEQPQAELVTVIENNGISGIEWLPASGEIIGAQLRHGSILAVSPSGEIRELVPGNGIVTPMGIAFSPCGELAVTNDDGSMMTLVDSNGEVSWLMDYVSFIPPVPHVTFDENGTLYASEGAPGYLSRVISLEAGNIILDTLAAAEYPSGITRRADGVIFFSETTAGKITRVSPDGTAETFIEGLDYPQGLAFDIEGNLYVAVGQSMGFVPNPEISPAPQTGDRVIKISPDGEVSKVASIAGAASVAWSPEGDLFITSSRLESAREVSSVIRISPDGEESVFASGFEDAVGLAFDLAGNLYISDEHANGIIRIGGFSQGTLNGIVLDSSGEPVAGARVQVLAVDPVVVGGVVYSDPDGFFSLQVAPRSYSVHVSCEGYEMVTIEDIEINAGEDSSIEISLVE